MQLKHFLLTFFSIIISLLTNAQNGAPAIKKDPKVFNEHGGQRTDNYMWLSNPSDSNVINYLKAENAYVEATLKHTEDLQKKLYDEIVARIPGKDQSLAEKTNGYWHYTRFEDGEQYPVYARKKNTMAANEEMVLDVPEMAKKHKIFLVRGYPR